MKKILLPLAISLGAAGAAQAQKPASTVGLSAAYARTQLTSINEGYKGQGHSAYQAGLTADVYVSEVVSFHPELLYTMQYYDQADAGRPELNRDITYLNLPLLARYHAGGLFFEAGPQLNLPLTVKDEDGGSVKSEARSLSLDYVVGLGYQLPQGLSLGVRYDGGLTPVFKEYDTSATPSLLSTGKLKTSTFLLVLGYTFGGR